MLAASLADLNYSSCSSPSACLETWSLAGAALRLSGHQARRRATSARQTRSPARRAAGVSPRIAGHGAMPPSSRGFLHVPTIALLSGLSAGRRSCPPTQPDRFLAADRRVRMAASQSRPAPSFRCTCVTIVIIGGSPYTSRDALGLTLLPDPPAPAAPAASSGPVLRGLEVAHQLELRGLLDGEIGGPPPQEIRRLIHRVASEPSPSAETTGSSTTICPDCLVTRPKSPA